MLRSICLCCVTAAFAACSGQDARTPMDAGRFEKRDGALPTPDVSSSDVADADAADAVPLVDVTLHDAPPVADTAPPADASHDVAAGGDAAAQCMALAEEYAAAVREAQACMAATECAASVCETLCCACRVYANPATAQYRLLMTIQDRWTTGRCAQAVTCPTMQCSPPRSSDCSSEGRCVTLRGT